MLATWRRLPQILIGRGLPARWWRRSSVQLVRQLLDAASRSLDAPLFPHPGWEAPLLLRTEVVWACRPSLLAIIAALDDTRQPIPPVALRRLKTFLTDPGASPLFGTNSVTARRAAEQLQRSFTGHPNANH